MEEQKNLDSSNGGDRWLTGFIPYLLYRVTNRLNARLQTRLRSQKINPSRWRVLSVLKAYGTMSVTEIVDATLMEQPTVSRVVAQLEDEGRVSRRASSGDSRVTEVTLTKAGEEAFEAIMPTAVRHQDQALQGLTDKEKDTLVTILRKVEKNIDLYS